MAQIIPVVSEALQTTIRRLLPSQNGFGEDLQAQNVIVPIIDLTPSAEGSILGNDLQTALAYGSQTVFEVANTTTTLANSTGFWRFYGLIAGKNASTALDAIINITDGITPKQLVTLNVGASSASQSIGTFPFDFIVFLAAGESITAVSANVSSIISGSYRQIATVTGELVNPAGFVSQ